MEIVAAIQWRKQQLNQLTKLIKENYDEIFEAVGKDHLNSSGFRGIVDIAPAMGAISQAISNLDEWAADVPCKAPMFGDAFIRSEPKGVMLIIAPWNYPLAMVLDPLIPAIAAGNCVVIKPSEVSNHSSDVLFSLLNKYMDRSCVRTVLGGVPETTALLEQKWDHIMYTGNGSVGRIVMTAAAKNLTPVTLELGGKSPTYVDKSANIEKAAQKYQQLAKDAHTSGDPVLYENYLQHAEHFIRRLDELNVKPKEQKIESTNETKLEIDSPTEKKETV